MTNQEARCRRLQLRHHELQRSGDGESDEACKILNQLDEQFDRLTLTEQEAVEAVQDELDQELQETPEAQEENPRVYNPVDEWNALHQED